MRRFSIQLAYTIGLSVMTACFAYSAVAATAATVDINTCTDLQNIKDNLQGQYQLTADIDCNGTNFTPIGNITTPFSGLLDGAGHKIAHLSIQKSGVDYVGLFGATNGARIQQLTLENVSVVGNASIGALIGQAANSTVVTNVKSSGSVSSEPGGSNVGGLVGALLSKSSVTDSSSSATTRTVGYSNYVGGLIGFVSDAVVVHSHATGQVSGYHYIGGLVGYLSAGGSITDSYAGGAVNIGIISSGNNDAIGGLVGYLGGASTVTSITRSYATGDVNAVGNSGTSVGGLVGYVYNGSSSGYVSRIVDSFATGKVNGATYVGGLIGRADVYAGYSTISIANTYSTGAVTGTASLGGLIGSLSAGATVTNSYWDVSTSGRTTSAGGEGKSTENMYQQSTYFNWDFSKTWSIHENQSYPWLNATDIQVSTCAGLQNLNATRNASYRQVADIDCSGVTFSPIGSPQQPFTGIFDGDGFEIGNLAIKKEGQAFVGLFAATQDADILDIKLKNVYVSGQRLVGSLIGYADDNTRISNISADGMVEAKGSADLNHIGGLLGVLQDGYINRSSAAVTVNAPGADDVGGLVGQNHAQITNAYSLGAVNAATHVGGLVGDNTGAIMNTYATGKVSGGDATGGLIGSNSGTVTNSYWDTQTSAQAVSAGGEGKSTAQMRQQSTYVNWDFTSVWSIFNGYTYPWLKNAYSHQFDLY